MTFRTDFYGRKDKTPTFTDNRKRAIVEEHVVLVEEPRSKYIGHIYFWILFKYIRSYDSIFEDILLHWTICRSSVVMELIRKSEMRTE